MNLQELTSPLPKDWLTIQAKTLVAEALLSENAYAEIYISNGSASINNSSTLNIVSGNLVNGVIGATTAGTLTIQLPTASNINDFLNVIIGDATTSFKFTVCASNTPGPTTTVNISMNTGITTFNGAALTILPGVQKDLIFVQLSGNSNWVIYF